MIPWRLILIKLLAKSVGKYKKYAILTPILMIGEVAMEVLIPMFMAGIIDNGVYKGDMDYILKMAVMLIIAAFLSMFFGVLGGKTASKASSGFATNLRRDLFYHLQDFSFKNIDSFSTSSLLTRMTTDVQWVQQAFQMMIRICFRAPIMFAFAILMVVNSGGSLATVFAVLLPILAILIFILMKRVHPIFTRVFKKYDNLNRVVEENLTGIRTVKAYVREDEEIQKFNEVSQEIHDDFISAQKIMALTNPLMMGMSYVAILALSYLGARLINSGDLLTGQLMSIFTYSMQILMSLMMIAMIVVMLSIARASAQRIAEVLRTTPEMDVNPEGCKVVESGEISFNNVDFSYGGKGEALCLQNINVHIPSGSTVGILGATGSGKSTFISLIARLYDVTSGSVSVGGKDVREYSLEALRNNVAIVLQKNQLFSGTIRSNLAWGKEDATDEEMTNALKIADADFVFSSKDGLDSEVEQGGTNFSGGQKQRLCIARAVLKHPQVIIFDDSTSAVDTATDKRIREALKNEIGECTKLIIAQRVSSVMDADKIIILENGRINDMGSHEELLERNDIYKKLVEVQLGGKENA